LTEPTTVNKGLIVPNTGDLPGTWGSAAINPDLSAIDGMLGGLATISLTNSNVILTSPAGFTATPSAGPTQSQNGILRFTGTLSAAVTITLPLPGFYIVENLCTVGAYYVALSTPSPGNVIGAPPGEAVHIYSDGTSVKYVDLERVGTYVDFAVSSVPAWITACTVPPYLNCNGSTFSGTTYPVLAAYLGGTTLPDLQGRVRAGLNQGTGRITTAGSGVNGDVLLSGGGAQNQPILQANLPNISLPVTDPGHTHNPGTGSLFVVNNGGNNITTAGSALGSSATTSKSNTGITVGTGGSGTALTTMPPVAIAGITLIRAG